MRGQQTIQQTSMLKEVRVGKIIPLATRKAEVARSAVFEALQVVIHQYFLIVNTVVAGWKIKPTPARRLIRCVGIVLRFVGEGLDDGGVTFLGEGGGGEEYCEGEKKVPHCRYKIKGEGNC